MREPWQTCRPYCDGSIGQIGTIIGAVAALGAAAQGLVDVTKGFWINVDVSGFTFIKQSLSPFEPALTKAVGEGQGWEEALGAHWLDGWEKSDQKGIAKPLIRRGLSPHNAHAIGKTVQVAPKAFANAVAALNAGHDLTSDQINLLGRFDAIVDVRIDAAYERADRRYRSFTRNIGALFAVLFVVLLAVFAGAFLFAANLSNGENIADPFIFIAAYLQDRHFALALLVGAIAAPLAPVSKDLVSAMGAAVKALKAAKG